MIYLLDHDERRQKDFGIEKYISSYEKEKIITLYHKKEEIKTDITPLELSDFPNIKCFLLHLSFKDDKVAEDVVEIARENKIPIAIFTNQPNERIGLDESNKMLRVSSSLFYKKTLESFLAHYKFNGEIDLSLLYYPNEESVQISRLINNFKGLFLNKENKDIIKIDSVNLEKDLEKLFKLLGREKEYDSFLEKIEESKIDKYTFFQELT